jgi:enterochelin esterase family protein
LKTNDLWTRTKEFGTPLIERGTATFVWFGKKAPLLAGDFSDWERGELITLTQTAENVWTYQARFIEYNCSEATLGALLTHVLPLAQEHLDLIVVKNTPGAYGMLGASMGGLMALYSAMRLPQIFGSVISQSGAFNPRGYDSVLSELVRLCEPKPIRVWMDTGVYDFRYLISANRQMRDLLVERGYDVTYKEYNAGHNFPAWRDEIWRGLEHLYGKE